MTALSVSALLLAAEHPLLLGQSGFLLSYGAILGLELIHPVLSGLWENRLLKPFWAGFSIAAVTLPVMLTAFFCFPVYSFFLNLLVIPLMGGVMAFGLLALLTGIVFLPLGRAIFFPAHLILFLFRTGCLLTEQMPGSRWLTGQPGKLQIGMYLVLLLLFCLIKRYMTKPCALLLLLGGVWLLRSPFLTGDTVTILDVGQGDGIVVQSRDGTAVLVDGGSSSEKKLAEYTLLPFLQSRKIRTLEYVFLTHMDEDHISGVRELLENQDIEIKTLVLPAFREPDQTYLQMAALARKAGSRVCTMSLGDSMEAGGFALHCMHPRQEVSYADRNAASLVLYLRKGKFSALLTGDLDGSAEAEFSGEYPESFGRITLLKAGHHGSKNACSTAFMEKIKPRLTTISCGTDNSYGHPSEETLNRIMEAESRVYVTKDTGAIQIWIRDDRIKIKTWLLSGSG